MSDIATYYRRAPFLLAQWDDDALVVMNCDDLRRCRLSDRAVSMLSRLTRWSTAATLVSEDPTITEQVLETFRGAGLVEVTTAPALEGAPHRGWEPLDVAFQRRSNLGGHRNGRPSATRFLGDARADQDGTGTALPPASQPPADFLDVLARRRSVRTYAASPVTLVDLASLLRHSARVAGARDDGAGGRMSFRPYASGGARSELEIHVVANAVEGLVPGTYRLDSVSSSLRLERTADDSQDALNRAVHVAAGHCLNRDPPVVLLLTAVFNRILSQYRNIGLGLVYRNVGCLLQTLYLVATALGLAPCALVVPREREVAEWLGLDPMVESLIACFVVGVPAEEDGRIAAPRPIRTGRVGGGGLRRDATAEG